MADVTPSTLRCLGTLDRRFVASKIAASGSSGAVYTQAGPYPGVPVAAQTSLARLHTSGEMAADTTIEVYTIRGGNPGPVSSSLLALGGASYAWRYSGDALYRGWDAPNVITDFAFIDRDTASDAWVNPHAVSRSDGYTFVGVQGAQRYVKVWHRARGATTFTSATVYDAGSAVYTSDTACPCLVVLPGDRLLCLFWTVSAGIQSSVSDDSGVTWSTPQCADAAFALAITTAGATVTRIRAAYSNGQILMVVSATGGYTFQLYSTDGGGSFTYMSAGSHQYSGLAEVVAQGGAFIIAYIGTAAVGGSTSVVPAAVRRIGSASTSMASATDVLIAATASTIRWGTVAGANLTGGDIAMAVDDVGFLWVVGSNFNTGGGATREQFVYRSEDGGSTWTSMGNWWYCNDSATHHRNMTVCHQGGRLLVASNLAANPGAGDDSLCITAMGGSSTVPMPQYTSLITLIENAKTWSWNWLPFDLPENTGATWTRTTAGAATVSFTSLGMRVLHSGVLDSERWAAVPATTNTQGIVAMVDVRAVVGTAEVEASISGGANGYTMRIEITPTAITLKDVIAASTIATISTTAGATGVQVKFGLGTADAGADTGKVYAWYRATSIDADHNWTIIGHTGIIAGTMLTRSGAVVADSVSFATSAGNAATDIYFRQVHYSEGTGTGINYYSGPSNPTGLLGQSLGAAPYPLAETGVRLAMTGANTVAGEQWTIRTAYSHGIERIDPTTSPSPDARWRSTTDAADCSIVYALTDVQAVQSAFYAIYLDGANFDAALWEGWDGAAWVTLGTLDLRVGYALKYTRSGPIIRCDPSGGSSCADHIAKEALVGATWKTGAGGIFRRIQHNTGGRWNTASAAGTIQRPIITLESYDSGDAASGTGGAIYSPRGALILRGMTTGYSRYRLYISAQDTADNYFTIGTLGVFALTVLGTYDYRDTGISTNVETATNRKGSRRKTRLGRPPRFVQLAWPDGVDTSAVHDTSPSYVRDYTSGDVVGTPAQLPSDIVGLIYENDVDPVLYLPSVPVPASIGNTMITAADLMLYADIATDTIQLGVVVGDEHTGSSGGELVRVGTVRLDEVL